MKLTKIEVTQEDIEKALADIEGHSAEITTHCPLAQAFYRVLGPVFRVQVERTFTIIYLDGGTKVIVNHSPTMERFIWRFDHRGQGQGFTQVQIPKPHTFKLPEKIEI